MPTIDVKPTTDVTSSITKKVTESVLIPKTDLSAIDIFAGFGAAAGDATGNLSIGVSGRLSMELYKGTVSAGTLQKQLVYNSSDSGSSLMIAILNPVAASGDGDNGSSGLTVNWNVDPGTWGMAIEFTGNFPDFPGGIGMSSFAFKTGYAGCPTLYQTNSSGNGRLYYEWTLTVNA